MISLQLLHLNVKLDTENLSTEHKLSVPTSERRQCVYQKDKFTNL